MLSKFNGYDDLYKSGVHILCKDLTYDEIMVLLADEPLTERQYGAVRGIPQKTVNCRKKVILGKLKKFL